MQHYVIESKQMMKAGPVTSDNCNAITFKNVGVATAIINKEPLLTGEWMSINGLPGELDRTQYKVEFTGAGTKLLYIRIKYYVK